VVAVRLAALAAGLPVLRGTVAVPATAVGARRAGGDVMPAPLVPDDPRQTVAQLGMKWVCAICGAPVEEQQPRLWVHSKPIGGPVGAEVYHRAVPILVAGDDS
jgi:hypothetical protein